jgi:hypothetical protein
MGAGRIMDALVAEKVMGLVPCTAPSHTPGHKYHMPGPCHAQPDSPDLGGETKQYSTEIEAAWEVVERLERGAFAPFGEQVAACVEMVCDDGIQDERYYCAIFSPTLAKVESWGKTMPEAICRASLKAIGEGKEGRG